MYSGLFLFFFHFVFHAKSGSSNNRWTWLSDLSYLSLFICDSNHIIKLQKFLMQRKANLKFLKDEIFRLNSSELSERSGIQQFNCAKAVKLILGVI